MNGEKKLLKAKETKYPTVLYSHECPYCGDPCDDYQDSLIGQTNECICGHIYEVVK